MSVLAAEKKRWTVEEYLAMESTSLDKHEFFGGAVAHEPEQVPRAEGRVDRAFVFEDRHTADPRPEPAQNERLMILPFDADSAQQQDVRPLGLNRQPHLGLHLEVRRRAALNQVDEGEVPEVEGQLHKWEPILTSAPSLPDLDRTPSFSNPFLSFRQLDVEGAFESNGTA
ncbi:MAG: hypothetical protein HUU21_34620 [Polyangiaceae bacterium]|nr:hypothetical protein [Polyangiaceae bacterium]